MRLTFQVLWLLKCLNCWIDCPNFGTDSHVPLRITLMILLTFHLVPSSGQNVNLSRISVYDPKPTKLIIFPPASTVLTNINAITSSLWACTHVDVITELTAPWKQPHRAWSKAAHSWYPVCPQVWLLLFFFCLLTKFWNHRSHNALGDAVRKLNAAMKSVTSLQSLFLSCIFCLYLK